MNLAFSVIAMEWFDKISEFMEGEGADRSCTMERSFYKVGRMKGCK